MSDLSSNQAEASAAVASSDGSTGTNVKLATDDDCHSATEGDTDDDSNSVTEGEDESQQEEVPQQVSPNALLQRKNTSCRHAKTTFQLVNDRLDEAVPAKTQWHTYIHDKIPPGVNGAYFARCYNNADSTAVKSRNTAARATARDSGLTYQHALRQLVHRICLDAATHPRIKKSQKEALFQTRSMLVNPTPHFFRGQTPMLTVCDTSSLGNDFVQFVEEHGIEVNIGEEVWTYKEVKTAAQASVPQEHAAPSRKRKRAASTTSDSE